MTEYARFPMETVRFSSLYNSSGHLDCSKGKPCDYPTDLTGNSASDRMWMVNKFGSNLKVLRKYPYASHSLWLRTVDKVYIPCCKDPVYLYIMVEHHDNNEAKKVNGIYKPNEKIVREAANGRASGPHLHCSFGYSKQAIDKIGSGWKCNTRGAWVLYIPGVTNIRIEEALYLDKSFSKTIKDKRVPFLAVPPKKKVTLPKYEVGKTYTLQEDMNIRIGHSSSAAKVPVSKWTEDAQKHATKDGCLAKGTKVTVKDIYKEGNVCWLRTPSNWICGYSGDKVYVK